MEEYVVTLKSKDDLDEFYDDMETPGGNLYIPDRSVALALRRPISRNTHYYLTEEEAVKLGNDPRVLSVERLPAALGMKVRSMWTQTSSDWNKSSSNTSSHKNWALLRCTEGVQRSGWGSNATAGQTATVSAVTEGRNVDVVVVDGHINPSHPEYAVNSDGTGGSRVIQYNWFQHNLGAGTGTYTYTPYTGTGAEEDNNHGAHVAGTIAGNTQGWARSANIYNISPYGTNPNSLNELLLFDYIRAFHNNKSVNPATGRPNPTICNNSWGYSYSLPINLITNIYYRGGYVGGAPYNYNSLMNYGIENSLGYTDTLARYTALEADLQDAITDGIIMVGAAGNSYAKIDVPGGLDYNNFYIWNGSIVFYVRGGAPNSTPNNICVGSVGATSSETKAEYSMCGPRIDIFSPGSNIMSSVNSTASGGTADPRNSSYSIAKYNGTSMASPQVCGVLACALETYPTMTQAMAKQYITNIATTGQMTDTAGGYSDHTALQGAANRFLYYKKERESIGQAWPKRTHFIRPSSGAVYPRTRIKRK